MSRKIKDLNPGQAGWTVPWALHEAQGRQWLHPDYPAGHEPFGTLQMKVTALVPKGKSDKRRYRALDDTVELAPFGGPEARPAGDTCCSDCKPNDTVEHETWLEYHDRLIREYYDADAEWALIKEICPEVEKARPAQKRVRSDQAIPLMIAAGIQSLTATFAFLYGAYIIGVVAMVTMTATLILARR